MPSCARCSTTSGCSSRPRAPPTRSGRSSTGSRRRRAHDYADPAGADTVAVVNVIRLATELNVVDRELAEKDGFVALLGPSRPPELERALEDWLERRIDAEALLDAMGPGL